MEITKNSNLIPFLNKKVRVITEINSVFIGKLYFVDGKKNFKLSNCREFITRFGVYRYNGFFKNVNFNGGKKMTIDFDFNYPPLVTENSTISSMVYSSQHSRKTCERIQGKQSVAVPIGKVTKKSNPGPMICNLEESRSSQSISQGNSEVKPPEIFLPDVARPMNAGAMFCDPEDLKNQRSGLPEIYLRGANKRSDFYESKTSNLKVKAPEIFPKIGSKSCDLEKPSASQRIIPGNRRIEPSKGFPRHVRRESSARQGNQKIELPETITPEVTNQLNVKTRFGNSDKMRIMQEDQRVEHAEVSPRGNNMNSKYILYDRSSAFQKSNQGNQNLESQDVLDATNRMEALSMICNSEMPSTSWESIQGNQNGIPFYINNHENARLRGENVKVDEERSVIPYNRLPLSAAQNLPVFPNNEEQNFGNQGSFNFFTHALICVPIIIKMEFRLSN